jgi:NADPH2:quinone reductase
MTKKATMRAMVVEQFGPPENLKQTTVEIREPGPDEVLIRVAAAAVNPVDIGMRAGRYQWHEPLRMPLIPGYDVAGTVEQGTDELPAGTPVIAFTAHSRTQVGGYAEYVTLPARYVAQAPATLDPAAAAALPLAGLVARQALATLGLSAGQTLAVNGPEGAVGRFVVQSAEHAGIEVRDAGPVDAALDVVGGAAALDLFARVADDGRYATIVPEFWKPGGQFTPARGIEPVTVIVDVERGGLAEVAMLADAGVLRPHIAKELPLASAPEAHEIMERGGGRGKLIQIV